jgi:NAD(P)-dependent dehydrogenase (short-subunit alcohol dehydrogenase family)
VTGLLDGRVAIVSGVGPGLGRSVALALAAQGAHVVLGARRAHLMAELAAELGERGLPAALGHGLDVTDARSCEQLVDATMERFGRIDVLVNNAMHVGRYGRADTLEVDDWRAPMETNLFGALQMTHHVVPHMVRQGSGSIVNVNTMGSQVVRPHGGPYATAKGALATLTVSLAVDLGGSGVRVNGVLPGYIGGPSLDAFLAGVAAQTGRTDDDVRAEVAGQIALRRVPSADEVAGAVVFFASALSAAVTGQNLLVNGGLRLPVPGMTEGVQPVEPA